VNASPKATHLADKEPATLYRMRPHARPAYGGGLSQVRGCARQCALALGLAAESARLHGNWTGPYCRCAIPSATFLMSLAFGLVGSTNSTLGLHTSNPAPAGGLGIDQGEQVAARSGPRADIDFVYVYKESRPPPGCRSCIWETRGESLRESAQEEGMPADEE
jgi:hypothetical protein